MKGRVISSAFFIILFIQDHLGSHFLCRASISLCSQLQMDMEYIGVISRCFIQDWILCPYTYIIRRLLSSWSRKSFSVPCTV